MVLSCLYKLLIKDVETLRNKNIYCMMTVYQIWIFYQYHKIKVINNIIIETDIYTNTNISKCYFIEKVTKKCAKHMKNPNFLTKKKKKKIKTQNIRSECQTRKMVKRNIRGCEHWPVFNIYKRVNKFQNKLRYQIILNITWRLSKLFISYSFHFFVYF